MTKRDVEGSVRQKLSASRRTVAYVAAPLKRSGTQNWMVYRNGRGAGIVLQELTQAHAVTLADTLNAAFMAARRARELWRRHGQQPLK